MRENRLSGLEGGGARNRSPYPYQNGSYTGGGLPPVDRTISERALLSVHRSLEFSHFTSSRMMSNSR